MLERELEYIYDTKILIDTNHIHDNKVNNISEFNLLHDILITSKRTKNMNSRYPPIIYVCMNIRRCKEIFDNF